MGEFEKYNGTNARTLVECEEHGENLHVTKSPFRTSEYLGVCFKCGKNFKLDTQVLEEQFNV